jgi:hypothetical protein
MKLAQNLQDERTNWRRRDVISMAPTQGTLSFESSTTTHGGLPMATNPNANKLLQQVTEGMRVVDASGEDVGKVTFVQFTDPGAVTNDPARDPGEGSFVEDLAEAFTGASGKDDEIEERLLKQGYIRVDGGVIGDDKLATSGQIAVVSGDVVRLSVSKDTL